MAVSNSRTFGWIGESSWCHRATEILRHPHGSDFAQVCTFHAGTILETGLNFSLKLESK